MLVKEICKNCVNSHGSRELNFYCWFERDEVSWKTSELILCPRDVRGYSGHVSTSGVPPKWCCFALEHMILQQKDVGK